MKEVREVQPEDQDTNAPKRFKAKQYPETGTVLVVNSATGESVSLAATKHTRLTDIFQAACKESEIDPGTHRLRRWLKVHMGDTLADMSPYDSEFVIPHLSKAAQKVAKSSSSSSSSSDDM